MIILYNYINFGKNCQKAKWSSGLTYILERRCEGVKVYFPIVHLLFFQFLEPLQIPAVHFVNTFIIFKTY